MGKKQKNKKIDKERKSSLYRSIDFYGLSDYKNLIILPEKVSLCTVLKQMKKASLAVETAMVLPLFLLGMITIISFMDIYKLQTEHLQKLCQSAKEAGMYAYTLSGNAVDDITLPDIYSYTPVCALVPLSKVWMVNKVRVHAWTGADADSFSSDDNDEEMVYVTETGSVYHTSPGCHYLNLSIDQVAGAQVGNLRNTYGEKYSACETCSHNSSPSGAVYVTSAGNRYHNLESCGGLKRTVRMVKLSGADGMHACSRCG